MSVKEAEKWEPKILAFCCNWCTYTGADLAGLNRMKYPANVRVVRLPCSSRVNPQFILRAFQKGCDGVMVCGCHPGDGIGGCQGPRYRHPGGPGDQGPGAQHPFP